MTEVTFPPPPAAKAELDEAGVFTPRFDEHGLLPAIVVDAATAEPLMLAYMNAQSLALTISTGEAHFWSRSRGEIWRKGATSGNVLRVIDMRTDCDQDALLIRAELTGDGVACHTGRRSCFYRAVEAGGTEGAPARLIFISG
jgi:phosphoribosyl-AMP cyclohydrolase